MAFANTPCKKIVANLKEKYKEMKQCQCLTKAIRNLGNVKILKFLALNKISTKLKINRFKTPNYAYTHRWVAYKKKPNTIQIDRKN